MIGSTLEQLGLPYSTWSGTTTIVHDVLAGTATQYEQANGLSMILIECHTKIPLSITDSVTSHSSITLWALATQPANSQSISFQASVGTTVWKLLPNQRYTLQVINLAPSWLQENIPTIAQLPDLESTLHQLLVQDALLVQLIRAETEKLWERHRQQALEPLFTWKAIYTMLYHVFDRLHQQGQFSRYTVADQQRVEAVQQYLINNLSNSSISVTVLAQMANMSLTKFNRLFKEIYSVSVRDFIAERRLQVANELLATHQYTISQVALKVGFTNASGLTKLFQKKYGISPKTI